MLKSQRTYAGILRSNDIVVKPVFMHNIIRFLAMRSSPFVKHKCLPHADSSKATVYDFISSGGFPETSCSGTICSGPCRIFLVFVTKKVPIILGGGAYIALVYNTNKKLKFFVFKEKKLLMNE